MATFVQNIQKIEGEAVYGPEMRTAIAEAIQQTMDLDIHGSSGTVFFSISPIQSAPEDHLLTILNGQ